MPQRLSFTDWPGPNLHIAPIYWSKDLTKSAENILIWQNLDWFAKTGSVATEK